MYEWLNEAGDSSVEPFDSSCHPRKAYIYIWAWLYDTMYHVYTFDIIVDCVSNECCYTANAAAAFSHERHEL